MDEYARLATLAAKAFVDLFDPLDNPTIAYLAETFRAESLAGDEAGRWDTDERELHATLAKTPGITSRFKGEERQRWSIKRRETLEASEAHNASLIATGDMEGIRELWAWEANEFATARGYRFDTSAPAFDTLCRAIAEASLSASRDAFARLDGQTVPTPQESEKPTRLASPPPVASSNASFEQIVEEVITNTRIGTGNATMETTRTALRYFREAYGKDIAPPAITRSHVSDWLDLLAQRPSRLPKSDLRLTLAALAEKYADQPQVPRLKGKTINQSLNALSAVWRKGQAIGKIRDGDNNPFARHIVKVAPAPESPKEFSIAELQTIFALPIFTAGERPQGGKGGASYWIPCYCYGPAHVLRKSPNLPYPMYATTPLQTVGCYGSQTRDPTLIKALGASRPHVPVLDAVSSPYRRTCLRWAS
ncbi:hypothetical protein [Sphingomonas paeninsulae]|nr:hypothetical protein [Sphingomonas paeninsulae]